MWRSDLTRVNHRFAIVAGLLVLGCGRMDGLVGKKYLSDASVERTLYETDFADNSGEWELETNLSGAATAFGQGDPSARDGKAVELTFPGNSSADATDFAGPDYVTQIATVRTFSFGTLRTRIKFGDCAEGDGVIQSVLGYYRDGSDSDGNGLTDDLEVSIQMLCGTSRYLYLTVFTDYESDSRFRKLTRVIDFMTGDQYETRADDSDDLVLALANSPLKRTSLVESNQYYELGFEWQTDQLRFFLLDAGADLTLWTLDDKAHVPQRPMRLMYNIWHTPSQWFPASGVAPFPSNNVVMTVDWLEYQSPALL